MLKGFNGVVGFGTDLGEGTALCSYFMR